MTRYRQNREIAWRAVEGQAILIDTREGMMRQLSPVATLVWDALEEERTVEEIAARVAERFDVTVERARADVESFLPTLVSRNLVVELA